MSLVFECIFAGRTSCLLALNSLMCSCQASAHIASFVSAVVYTSVTSW